MNAIKTDIKYPIAFDSKSNIIRADDPDIQIRRSAKTCCGCGESMHYVNEFIRSGTLVTGHFRHTFNNPNCTVDKAIIGGESVIHARFKNLLFDHIKGNINKELFVELRCDQCEELYNHNLLVQDTTVELEYQNDGYRPDIALLDPNNKLYLVLEIVVTHSPEPDYLNFLKSHKIKLLIFEINIEKSFDYWVSKYISKDGILRPSSISFIDFNICDKPRCNVSGKYQDSVLRIFKADCWSCGYYYLFAFILYYDDNDYPDYIGPEDFSLEQIEFARSKGVMIEWRYSHTIRDYYYAIVCPACNNIHGQFFHHEYIWWGKNGWENPGDYEDYPIVMCPEKEYHDHPIVICPEKEYNERLEESKVSEKKEYKIECDTCKKQEYLMCTSYDIMSIIGKKHKNCGGIIRLLYAKF